MKRVKQAAKNYFIPHEGNEYKPRILRPRTIAFVCMVALVAESVFVFGVKYVIPQSKLFGIVEANALVDETNQSRVANKLPDLQVSSLLQAAAQEKANDMATKGYFAHTSPQGLTPWYWFENVGYSFDYAGENLAVNFSDSQDVTNAWMNSAEHRANILSTDFTQIGIATAHGVYNGVPTTYVVEEFGTPAPAAAPVAFANTANAASVPTVAPALAVTPASAPAPALAPIKKTSVAVKKPTSVKVAVPSPGSLAGVPVVVSMQSSSDANIQQAFVAVKGAATQTVPVTPIIAPTDATVQSMPTAVTVTAPISQSNIVQQLLSNPRSLANNFYLFLMVLFLLALVLNIFINIRVQYPRLILGGLLVVVVAGLCVMLNQNIGFLHTVIL